MDLRINPHWLRALNVAIVTVAATGTQFAQAQQPRVTIKPNGDDQTLTVKYRNVSVASIELRVNGVVLGNRKTGGTAKTGETLFLFDENQLAPGEHTVEARLLDAKGRLISTQQAKIWVDFDPLKPISIITPHYGSEVYGTFDVQVNVADSSTKPYVTIFINNEVRALRNFPPYTYTWDTTQEPNGWYEISAMSYDENQVTRRSAPSKVFVNNPTGRTERQEFPLQPAPAATTNPAVPKVAAQPAAPKPAPVKSPAAPVAKAPSVVAKAPTPTPKVSATLTGPVAKPRAVNLQATAPKFRLPANRAVVQAPQAKLETRTVGQKLAVPDAPAEPKVTATVPKAAPKAAPAAAAPKPIASGRIAPLGQPAAPVVKNTAAPAARPVAKQPLPNPAAQAKAAVSAPKPTKVAMAPRPATTVKPAKTNLDNVVSLNWGTRLKSADFTVWVNGRKIDFDVNTHVVNGVATAPIRGVVESLGGSVDWSVMEKTVRAEVNGSEIKVRLNDLKALVDGRPLRLEAKPTIQDGRMLVPMSLFKEAEVTLQYDAANGRIIVSVKD